MLGMMTGSTFEMDLLSCDCWLWVEYDRTKIIFDGTYIYIVTVQKRVRVARKAPQIILCTGGGLISRPPK